MSSVAEKPSGDLVVVLPATMTSIAVILLLGALGVVEAVEGMQQGQKVHGLLLCLALTPKKLLPHSSDLC